MHQKICRVWSAINRVQILRFMNPFKYKNRKRQLSFHSRNRKTKVTTLIQKYIFEKCFLLCTL